MGGRHDKEERPPARSRPTAVERSLKKQSESIGRVAREAKDSTLRLNQLRSRARDVPAVRGTFKLASS